MKKVYAMMAMALGFGLCATAAPELTVNRTANAEAIVAVEPIGEGVAVSPAYYSNGPAKAVTSTDDLAGMKKWSGTLMFGQKDHNGTMINGPQAGVSFAEDARATRITINNFPSSGMSLRLNVNLAKKEVSFNSGVIVGEANTDEGIKEVGIYVRKHSGIVYDEESGLWKYKQKTTTATKAVGKILDDGSISFEGYTLMAQSPDMVEEGSVYLMLNTADIVFVTTPFNTPVESEYTYVGDGEFKDPFFAARYNDPSICPVNKKAQIYTKKVGDDIMVAVKNPYKQVPGIIPTDKGDVESDDWWKETGNMYEGASGDGWLLFQVFKGSELDMYPGVVACIQMVPCGMEMDNSEEEDGSEVEMTYPFNEEGAALYSGGIEGLLSTLQSFELAEEPKEYSNVENNVIYIRNTYFGQGQSPIADYWWGHYETPGDASTWVPAEHIVGTVTLPAGWDGTSAVNSILGDGANAPVKYYNLQGIELSAPVKGQLTIKKQGNKTVKFIAK